MKRNANVKKKPEKLKYANGTYTVVKFIENSCKLFACLPDLWMVNEEKTACFWPPKSGKSVTLRAMNQDEPDDDWEVYECEVISEGHATYSIGSNIVREKASQPYNTSSADEHVQATEFRRKHPGLIDSVDNTFENMFAAADANKIQKAKEAKDKQNKEVNSNVETNSGQITSLDKTCETGQNKENDLSASSLFEECNIRTGSGASIQSNSTVVPQSQTSGLNDSSKSTQSPRSTKSRSHRSKSRSNHSQSNSNHSQSINKHSQSRKNHSKSPSHSQSGKRNSSGSGNRLSSRNHSSSGTRSSSGNRSRSRKLLHSRNRSRSGSGRRFYSGSSKRNEFRSRSISHSKSSIHSISSRSRYNSVSKSYSPLRHSIHSRSISHSKSSVHSISSGSHYDSVSKNHSPTRPRQDSRSISRDISRFGSKSNSYCSVSSLRSSNHSRSKSGFRSNINPRSRRRTRSRSILRLDGSCLRSRESRSSSERSTRAGTESRKDLQRSSGARFQNTTTQQKTNATSGSERTTSNLNYSERKNQNAESISSGRAIPQSTIQLNALIDDLNKLANVVNKNNRRFIENDRRLTRMEVTINKTFVMLGDLTNAFNVRMSIVGNSSQRDVKLPRGFHMPRLPIQSLKELTIINRDFKDKEFLTILINHEREYCTPSNSTDTATLTGYLKRFISVPVRASLVLKNNKGQSGLTLYHDFQRVYLFIIDVMKAGYLIKNKVLTNKDIHGFLRVVWGRSKQMLGDSNKPKGRHDNKSRRRSKIRDSRRRSKTSDLRRRSDIGNSSKQPKSNSRRR